MRRFAILLALGIPAMVLAQSPSDFARGATIQADGGSIYRALLPDDVYETAVRADLGDLRVLNAAGEPVPHTLREVPAPETQQRDWAAVPSFPMSDIQPGGASRTQVRVGADGTVLEVTNDAAARQTTTAYLLDMSGLKEEISALEASWQAAPDATFVARVSVQASDDLNTWRTIVASTLLTQLKGDTGMFTQREVDLPTGTRAKYLRLSWPQELTAVTLAGVRARPPTVAGQREIRWRTLDPQPGETPASATFDTRARLPVRYLHVTFASPTDAATVSIRSRDKVAEDWRDRYTGLFYTLTESGAAIQNPAARITETADRYWSVETTRPGGWTRAPRLRVGWHGYEIVFLAQGEAPYTLVYGSGRVEPAEAPVEEVLARLDAAEREQQIRTATLGAPRDLAGDAVLKPGLPVKRIVLWSVLVIVVGALGILAARLARDATST